MDLSFIIPYYNAEVTIIKTLDSIYTSGLDDNSFEVIIIDDCSTVPATTVLKDIGYKNLRIVRHSQNLRQGAGRNTGIRHAKGEYIAFVDADDIVKNGISSSLFLAKEYRPDIVDCRIIKQDFNGTLQVLGHDFPNVIMVTGPQFCNSYLDLSYAFIPCKYLYRKEYLFNVYSPFPERVFMEDGDWVARHLFYSKKTIISSSIIYKYIYYPTSTIHSRSCELYVGAIKTGYRKILLANEISYLSKEYSELLIHDARWNINGAMRKLWTINNLTAFYRSVTYEEWSLLKKMRWPLLTSILIKRQRFSECILTIIGPLLRCFRQIKISLK